MSSMPVTASPAQLLFPDLETELATTRRMLARVPDGRADWRPHDKSMTLGRLASHVAELPGFGIAIMSGDGMDFAKGDYVPAAFESSAQNVALFDEKAAQMRAAIERADWNALEQDWTLRMGDRVILRDKKRVLLRTFSMSHIGHHRAQLGVYLRLLDIAVPGVYGPTADEQ